jgi:serine/threonine protein kinase/WD40 repeat protein
MSSAKPDEEVIFKAARRLPPGESRDAYLAEACGGDEALRRRVQDLLRVDEEEKSFLAAPAVGPAGTADRPAAGEAPGATFGAYKLIEPIGEGGMGTVWMAQQTEPVRRLVAVKLIKAGMDSAQVIARFEAERQALALMDHPNIARVLDAGTTDVGRPYFVMDLVKGVPITKYCDDHHLTPQLRLELFIPVCQALQHAHQKGITHRDLKPSNVLVAPYDGRPVPKVIDFGVAKAAGQQLTERTLVTGFGALVGTLEYMSPEQAELNNQDIDTRSDIYTLGVLLYELLTGTPPFSRKELEKAGMMEMLRVIREQEPSRPSTKLSTAEGLPTLAANRGTEPAKLTKLVRGELDWIVMKALEKDRNRRYETANGLARDIERYLADESVEACPPSAAYRLRKFARRHKGGMATAGLIAAALIVGSVASSYFALKANTRAHEADDARIRATAAEREAREGENRALQAERRARFREADALLGQAHGARYSRRPGQRFEALEALGKAASIGRELGQPPAWFEPLRNEAIAALALPDIHIRQEFGAFPPGTVWVDLNETFTLYVRTTEKGGCSIRRVAEDTEVCRLPELGEPADAGFGSGALLAVRGRSSGRFQLWDVSGSQPNLRFAERSVYSWHFHPDGGLLGLVCRDGGIGIYDTATGSRLHRLAPTEAFHDLWVKLHPTAPLVAACSYFHRVVQVRELRSGAVVASALPPWLGGNGHCAWSPDGRTLLVSQGDGGKIQQYAFDPTAPALRATRTFQSPMDQGCAYMLFHPAGDHFVSRGWSNHVCLFDVPSGQLLFSTHALPSNTGLRFDSTGERLAAVRVGKGNDRIALWSFAGGAEYRRLVHAGPQKDHNRPAVHPEGRLAAVGLEDGVVLFDLETGAQLAPFPGLKGLTRVAFDSTGNLLTNSFMGFFRWPVRPDPANSGRLRVGPPQLLPFNRGHSEISVSRDGRVIAQSMWVGADDGGGWIVHPNAPVPRRVRAGLRTGPCSVSPDGRWVAFAPIVNVFDAATGKEVGPSPAQAEARHCRFSPDGRWLATDGEGGRVYAAGTWEPGPQLGPGIPWDISPDSTLAIMGQSNGIYRLVELTSGRELARLEDPEQNTGSAAFTPDGTKLVVGAKNGLRVWDLRRIRAKLAKLGLDWNAPSYPPPTEKKNLAPVELAVDVGSLLLLAELPRVLAQARDYVGRSQWDKAAAEYAKADLCARPLSDDACAYACLFLIRGDSEGYNRFCEGMTQRAADTKDLWDSFIVARSCAIARNSPVDPARAVQWANQGVTNAPVALCFHALALAQYRAGQFDQALQSFTKANVKTWRYSELCWFGLALVHHRLGHPDEARRCLAKGIQWLEREGPLRPGQPAKIHPLNWLEAQLLRREAEEMLKVKRSP